MTGARILVVDDEPQILRALRTSLRGAGYEVDTAETVEAALAAAAMRPPEAVVLDLVLPDGSGTDVARELRNWSSAPIIVLSAVGEEREKVAALDAGADDYVTKPVGIDELLARLRAVLRRTAPSGEPVIEVGELVVDLPKREVRMAGKPVHLTPHQYDLLRVLALTPASSSRSGSSCRKCGDRATRTPPICSRSTSPSCAASSSPTARIRAIS